MASSLLYDNLKKTANEQSSRDSRVEVNQRALIDKILARYASAGAVYRELLQNSNDAEAKNAEIYFTVSEAKGVVSQVIYRNDGMPFRPQDWSRLQKIAEGNPDEKKVGAFGVGAYTMFSICEEPTVVSGSQALLFVWKGDALWTKTVDNASSSEWTTFLLPSRDPYPLPSLEEFGKFLCSSLTFTQSLKTIRVFVNEKERLCINKSLFTPPRVVTPPKSSSWLKSDGAVTQSPSGLFSLMEMYEEIQQIAVVLDDEVSTIKARYVSGTARTSIPPDKVVLMERVTKKRPPEEVTVQIYISAEESAETVSSTAASRITEAFAPGREGAGRVFIGFRTSQTTGLAAHLAAPLIPTVEREAIDLQDPTLKLYNIELLEFSGILMRLTLEHSMSLIGEEWIANTKQREALEAKLLKEPRTEPEPWERQESSVSDTDSSSSIMTFAKYMAKGVTKKIVGVVNTVSDALVDDGSAELLNPRDPRPLSEEERHAILLMRSFCPEQSTPDTMVGTALARGFSRCMPTVMPPVLTKSGVLRGEEARLPHHGIEAFCQTNVVRQIVYRNADVYIDVLAHSRRLSTEDLISTLDGEVLSEDQVVRLIKWWPKFSRVEPHVFSRGALLKESVRFLPRKENEIMHVQSLKDILYYVDDKSIPEQLPVPSSVMSKEMQERISTRTLTDSSLKSWFAPLPVEVWAEFICRHPCMVAGQPEDEITRSLALVTLSKEYGRRSGAERTWFANILKETLSDKRCIPFDSSEPTTYAAERPGDLYLNTAELKEFHALGSFNKASQSLMDAGVSEAFLITLGVRKSVAIEFLFSNIETLRWRNDPKPLIEYLRTASLTKEDTDMLRTTQYLPAENDISRTFAPGELYLPNRELRDFHFVKLLQWPSEDDLTERSANGKFLRSLGCMVHPPLLRLLQYVSDEVSDDEMRTRCLDYVVSNLGPNAVYEAEYARLRRSKSISNFKFLPCVWKEPLVPGVPKRVYYSPNNSYSDQSCSKMGFPVLDPDVEKKNGRLYATRFKTETHPDTALLLSRLSYLVATAKVNLEKSRGGDYETACKRIMKAFGEAFSYLSTRSTDFNSGQLDALKKETFIPCMVDNNSKIAWFSATDVYFRDTTEKEESLTVTLFHVVEFSPFLAAAGVQSEARTQDIFRLMITSPDKVLATLGSESKYRTLLRRIAANPPFRSVTPAIRNARFLLAYKIQEDDDCEDNGANSKANYLLAKADDIYIIDNSFFGRMFPVIRAPHESDLEDFYATLGSSYISKKVSTSYDVFGRQSADTPLTAQLAQRIKERSPLLVSPSVTSRPLVSNASSMLDDKNLQVVEAGDLKAVYALEKSVRNQRVTCCAKTAGKKKNYLYVTQDFDFFDVGMAVGGLILQRCQLEDAFFTGSLLEAPLEQLRARGFPVDRILRPPEPLPPEPRPVEPILSTPTVPAPANVSGTSHPSSKGMNENEATAQNNVGGDEGFETILQQMFPDCADGYIRSRLGPSPSLDDLQRLANEMTSGRYPARTEEKGSDASPKKPEPSPGAKDNRRKPNSTTVANGRHALKDDKKGKLGKRFGRAFGGFRGSSATGGGEAAAHQGPRVLSAPQSGPQMGSVDNDGHPIPPEMDVASHTNMEKMLRDKVGASTKVSADGVNSPETILSSLPEGLERGSNGCEVIPGHSLKPFSGQYRTGKTSNGIRVFSCRNKPESEPFLTENFHAVDCFADVLQKLCSIYSLDLSTIAIFHDPSGGTIAFNANRSLHFNVRFFFALHYQQGQQASPECYAYWFTTMAHELAHHFVSAHNEEHGFFTESYVIFYLPKLVALLAST